MWIDARHLFANTSHQNRCWKRTAHKQKTMSLRGNYAGRVPVGLSFRIKCTMGNVLGDSDYCDPRISRSRQTEREATSDRILIRKISRHESLIHDRDRLSARLHVLGTKIAPFDY